MLVYCIQSYLERNNSAYWFQIESNLFLRFAMNGIYEWYDTPSYYLSSLTENSVEDILQALIVFAVESLELDFALLFPDRHTLLRVLPILVVLATSSDKDSESLYKKVKINRLLNIFKV